MRITYNTGLDANQLYAYCGANYIANTYDGKSKSCYTLILNGRPITQGSHKHTCMASITTEPKYMATHLVTQEVIWTHRLFADLGFIQDSPTPLFRDNRTTITLVRIFDFHTQTKHINIKFYMVWKAQKNRHIATQYIPSVDQIANMFTKQLTKEKFPCMHRFKELTDKLPPHAVIET